MIVQPVLLESATWLAHVFDFDGRPLPDDVKPEWLQRTTALIMRRHAALNRAIVEDGWFDPLVLEFDEFGPVPLPTSAAQYASYRDAASSSCSTSSRARWWTTSCSRCRPRGARACS